MNRKKDFTIDDLLQPEMMLHLYTQGAFPMADGEEEINWYMPEERTVIPVDEFNIPRSLKKFLSANPFEFRYDFDQLTVIRECALREETWISERLIEAYKNLITLGCLHSVETYLDDKLVGGLYGIAYKGAFFGESMFSRVSQASKGAFVKLAERLQQKKFVILDVQYQTAHLKMFGAKEIPFDEFAKYLKKAYKRDVFF
jgi:leucyl/phenylalanyl-tRNA---protein transferase